MLPDESNRMTLSPDKRQMGLPLVIFDAAYGENRLKMRIDIVNDDAARNATAGLRISLNKHCRKNPGIGIHEMGAARMGRDPGNLS